MPVNNYDRSLKLLSEVKMTVSSRIESLLRLHTSYFLWSCRGLFHVFFLPSVPFSFFVFSIGHLVSSCVVKFNSERNVTPAGNVKWTTAVVLESFLFPDRPPQNIARFWYARQLPGKYIMWRCRCLFHSFLSIFRSLGSFFFISALPFTSACVVQYVKWFVWLCQVNVDVE